MVSNTFSTPAATKTINLARVDYNESMLSIATNFYGPSLPTSADISILGSATAPDDGWMYRDSKNGVLYIKDSANNKGLSGDFTVNGIGSRIIEDLSDYYGQESNFDLGELFKTTGSNARLYMKKSNTTGDGSITDVGIPSENYSITRAMLGNNIVDGDVVGSNVSVIDREEVINGQKNFVGNTFIVSNTDAAAAVGPIIELYRNSTSAADDDLLGRVLYKGNNDAGDNVEYAAITAKINDASDGTEDSSLLLNIMKAGTLTNIIDVNESNALVNFDLDVSQKVHSDTDLHASNALISTSNLYSSNATISNDASVGGDLNVTGAITAGSGLNQFTTYSSSNITVSASNQVYEDTHSLGKLPELFKAKLICTSAELGYLEGEEVDFPVSTVNSFGGQQESIGNIGANATHLFLTQKNAISIGDKASPGSSPTTITYGNWALKFFALAIS